MLILPARTASSQARSQPNPGQTPAAPAPPTRLALHKKVGRGRARWSARRPLTSLGDDEAYPADDEGVSRDQPAAPYQDPSLDVSQRVEDLLSRMEPADKAGLMFHDMVVMGPDGTLAGPDNMIARPPTAEVIQTLRMNHFNLLGAGRSGETLAWHNRAAGAGGGRPGWASR